MDLDQYVREQMAQGTSKEEAESNWKNLEHARKLVTGELPITPEVSLKALRGFAAMSKEERAAIASKGGKKSQASGKAHKYTSEEARQAGSKGGKKIAQNREHMIAIGKKGGAVVARDNEHMRAIGRKGGRKVSENREHMSKIGKKGGNTKASRS